MRVRVRRLLLLASGLALGAAAPGAARPAAAEEAAAAAGGCFVAARACPATPAIRRADNPGGVEVEAAGSYELLGRNKAEATHYRVRVPGAVPAERWVEAGCGRVVASCGRPGDGGGDRAADAGGRPVGGGSTDNLLAVSWHPAFCEGRDRRPECGGRAGTVEGFALHGLWPQPEGKAYCGVTERDRGLDLDRRWGRLPAVGLTPAGRAALEEVMPGTRSGLDRHQWAKHGTCYGTTAEEYFADAAGLMRELNAARPVTDLFAGSVGRDLGIEEVRDAFDRAFGRGAGDRVAMVCDEGGGRRLVGGLRLSLAGEVAEGAGLGRLLRAARPARRGCPAGEVDAAGPG